MVCSRVTERASPRGRAASVATTRNRSGWWISGSRVPVIMTDAAFRLLRLPIAAPPGSQAAQQVAECPGVGVEGRAALAGQGDCGLLRGPVPGFLAAEVAGLLKLAQL